MHGRVMLEVEMKQHSAADVAGGGEDLALLDEGEKLDREHHPTSSSARATRSTLVGGEVEEEGEDVAEGDALIPAALTDGEGGQRPGIPAMGDEQPILTAADFVAWGKRTWWMPDGITDMLGGTLWTWSENIFRGRGGYGAGSLVIVFCIFSARTFVVPLWTVPFIPVVSPVYGHGERWAQTPQLSAAILVHVASGIVMMVCGMCQFDSRLRKGNQRLHKLSGYTYIASGLLCLGALRPLRQSLAQEHGVAPTLFVEVASIMWVAATGMAVYCARKRDFVRHRRWMARSMACAISPAFQRLSNFFFLCPAALTSRFTISGLNGYAFWSSRWGTAQDFSLLQLFSPWTEVDASSLKMSLNSSSSSSSSPSSILSPAAAAAGAAAGPPLQPPPPADVDKAVFDAFPMVLSFDGYGVAEQLVFPASSWFGLVIILFVAETQSGERLSSIDMLGPIRDVNKMMSGCSPSCVRGQVKDVCEVLLKLAVSVLEDKSSRVPPNLPLRRLCILVLNLASFLLGPPLIALACVLAAVATALWAIVTILFFLFFVAIMIILIPALQYLFSIFMSLPFFTAGYLFQIFLGLVMHNGA